jgi:hypothetical protein
MISNNCTRSGIAAAAITATTITTTTTITAAAAAAFTSTTATSSSSSSSSSSNNSNRIRIIRHVREVQKRTGTAVPSHQSVVRACCGLLRCMTPTGNEFAPLTRAPWLPDLHRPLLIIAVPGHAAKGRLGVGGSSFCSWRTEQAMQRRELQSRKVADDTVWRHDGN